MIADHYTNTVYLVDVLLMDDSVEYKRFLKFLESYGLTVKVLKWTNDIYCYDYMPVHLEENDYVQFVFKPDKYYRGSEIELITNPVQVQIANKLQDIRYSKIILDGGNVVKWKEKVIITDLVFVDNRFQFKSDDDILEQLEEELKCKVIIIPSYPGDKTGHADGIIRFINENTVFINDTFGEPRKWLDDFLPVLVRNGLKTAKLPCPMKPGQKLADGLYINYLHVGDLVVAPQFGLKEDSDALQIMNEVFSKYNRVVPYISNKISEYGGVLNCVTWSVLSL